MSTYSILEFTLDAAAAAAAAKSLQLCPTLCDPIDSSSPGSPIPGILQTRIITRIRPITNHHHTKLLQHY